MRDRLIEAADSLVDVSGEVMNSIIRDGGEEVGQAAERLHGVLLDNGR